MPELDGWFDLRKRDEGVGPISMQILTRAITNRWITVLPTEALILIDQDLQGQTVSSRSCQPLLRWPIHRDACPNRSLQGLGFGGIAF